MAKKADVFSPDIIFSDAAQRLLSASFHKMMDNASQTRAGLGRSIATPEDIEALHDMRVGSRRLRAALSVFGSVLDKDDLRDLDKQVGAITDALGAVRDLDVQLDALRTLQNAAPPNEAYGLGRLIEQQSKRRDKERQILLVTLSRLKKDSFEKQFTQVLNTVSDKPQKAGR